MLPYLDKTNLCQSDLAIAARECWTASLNACQTMGALDDIKMARRQRWIETLQMLRAVFVKNKKLFWLCQRGLEAAQRNHVVHVLNFNTTQKAG